MGMPKRTSEHQVEDISITAIKSRLPRQWVYREKGRDYGIDGEIEIFDENNIKEILSTRDFMQEMRDMGMPTQGPPPFGKKDVHGFVNQLDRLLTRINK